MAKMRTQREKAMPETVYIQRLTRTSDGAGGWTEAWSTVETTTGRFAASEAAEQEIAGKLGISQPISVTLPEDADVTESDRLQISGVQYEVISILRKSKATALRLICKKL